MRKRIGILVTSALFMTAPAMADEIQPQLGKIDCRIEYQERVDFCLWENPAGVLGDIICLIDAVQDYADCVEDLGEE